MKKYRNYSDQDIIDKSKYVTSLMQLLIELNLKPAGGNFENMKRNLDRLNVNTEHWTGQAWSLDKRLKPYADYKKNKHIKIHMIIEKGHKCNKCKLSLWNDLPIILELEHKDGDRTNNNEENLELLCPNCHSQTPHWRGRKSDINW